MTLNGWLQIIVYLLVLVLLVKPLGLFMAKVYQGERTFFRSLSHHWSGLPIAWLALIRMMRWIGKPTAVAVLLFSAVGFVFLYLLQRLQGFLPLNPLGMGAVSPTCP